MQKRKIGLSILAILIALSLALVNVWSSRVLAEDGDDDLSNCYFCLQSKEQHPFGAMLAERYEVDYETLQGWFCEGYGWGQIMLALQTSKITGEDAGTLLESRSSGLGWGEIWQELGLIGKPDFAGPPNDEDGDGIPDFVSPPVVDIGDGLPDFVDPPVDDIDSGPPDFVDPPVDDIDSGPPDFVDPPVDDIGNGPPDFGGPPFKIPGNGPHEF